MTAEVRSSDRSKQSPPTDRKSNDSPDKGWAWVVLVAAFCNAAIIQGMLKSGGVLYRAFPESMDMTPGQAATIATISEAIMRAMAPVSGYLAQRLSYRMVVFCGGIISTLGLAACFFAQSFIEVLLTFGVMFGIGSGLILVPGDIIVGLYFNKYRAMALGIEFAGGPLGAVFVAPLLDWLILEYQLRGTLLLYAGLALHTCAGALIYRQGHWFSAIEETDTRLPKVASSATILSVLDDEESRIGDQNRRCKSLPNGTVEYLPPVSDDWDGVEINVLPVRNVSDFTAARRRSVGAAQQYISKHLQVPYEPPFQQLAEYDDVPVHSPNRPNANGQKLPSSYYEDSTSLASSESSSSSSIFAGLRGRLSFLRETSFWLVNITNLSMVMGFPMVLTMLPSYATAEVDSSLTTQEAAFLLSIFNLSDLFGRVSFGWLSDRRLFRRQTGFMGALLVAGGIVCTFPLVTSYTSLILCTVAYGVAIGSSSIFPAVILSEAVGAERFPVAYGFVITTSSIASFSSGPILGWLLNDTGSYKPCFYVLSGVLIAGGIVWLGEVIVRKIRGPSKEEILPSVTK